MANIRTKDNAKRTREYVAWKAMKSRCYSLSYKEKIHQIKGIQVCDRWINSFENFLEDMGLCPEGFSLDRYPDSEGNYSPDNCRWATDQEQSSNRGSFNILFTHQGVTKNLKDWSRHFNMSYTTLYSRVYKYNISFEKAISNDPFGRLITFNGKTQTLKEWSEDTGIALSRLSERKSRGWSIEKMLTTPLRKKAFKILL